MCGKYKHLLQTGAEAAAFLTGQCVFVFNGYFHFCLTSAAKWRRGTRVVGLGRQQGHSSRQRVGRGERWLRSWEMGDMMHPG